MFVDEERRIPSASAAANEDASDGNDDDVPEEDMNLETKSKFYKEMKGLVCIFSFFLKSSLFICEWLNYV